MVVGTAGSSAGAEVVRRAGAFVAVAAKLRSGALRPVVGEELALREAAAAHRRILEPGARES